MTAYAPQGLPVGRVNGPGWPQRSSVTGGMPDITGAPTQFLFVRSDRLYRIPAWATYCRLSATGNGGNGVATSGSNAAPGGAGGGFAGTSIVKVSSGAPIIARFDPIAAALTVDAFGYHLVAGNGTDATTSAAGIGGVGSGGDVNFTGGAGGASTTSGGGGGGGGAAGRGGNGIAGTASASTGGAAGGAGAPGVGLFSGASGGGAGATVGGTIGGTPGAVGASQITNTTTNGITLNPAFIVVGLPAVQGRAGDGGGGGGGYNVGGGGGTWNGISGGPGFLLIELW